MNCTEDFGEPLDTVDKVGNKLCHGLKGNQAAWDVGTTALDALEPPNPQDCHSVAAYGVLQKVAKIRRESPDAPFRIAAGSGTACPPTLDGLQPPDSVCAGDPIVLDGRLGGLPAGAIRTVNVGVGTTTAVVQYRVSSGNNGPFPFGDFLPFGDFYFEAPTLAAGGATRVDVTIAANAWSVKGTASLEYKLDQSTCPPRDPAKDPAKDPAPPAEKVVPPQDPAKDPAPPAEKVVPPQDPAKDPAPPGSIP
jgi:hypothetical protein